MFNIKKIVIALFMMLSTSVAFAGAGHIHGPVDRDTAELRAERVVTTLIKRGVLSASWQERQLLDLVRKQRDGSKVWLATYNSENAPQDQKMLYVFLSLSGNYLDANFSGK